MTLWKSPAGILRIEETDGMLSECRWTDSVNADIDDDSNMPPVIYETIRQLSEYFAGTRTQFDLPLRLSGTEFQLQVWDALREIPYGSTVSYRDIADRIGRRKSVRAVANAIGANPIAIIIPCHRVIGSDGSLTGYAGGIEIKRRLLALELPELWYPAVRQQWRDLHKTSQNRQRHSTAYIRVLSARATPTRQKAGCSR